MMKREARALFIVSALTMLGCNNGEPGELRNLADARVPESARRGTDAGSARADDAGPKATTPTETGTSGRGEDTRMGAADGTDNEAGELAVSSRPRLQWKRYLVLEADLMRALELPSEQLCNEFGKASCIREVHRVPLGGHEPFTTGMLESASAPLATTPSVVDRVVLSACSARVELDRNLGAEAKLFHKLDLRAAAPAPSAAATLDTVSALYRRLLGRDASEDERATVAELARDGQGAEVSAAEFATLACFTVGTSSEFLFF